MWWARAGDRVQDYRCPNAEFHPTRPPATPRFVFIFYDRGQQKSVTKLLHALSASPNKVFGIISIGHKEARGHRHNNTTKKGISVSVVSHVCTQAPHIPPAFAPSGASLKHGGLCDWGCRWLLIVQKKAQKQTSATHLALLDRDGTSCSRTGQQQTP